MSPVTYKRSSGGGFIASDSNGGDGSGHSSPQEPSARAANSVSPATPALVAVALFIASASLMMRIVKMRRRRWVASRRLPTPIYKPHLWDTILAAPSITKSPAEAEWKRLMPISVEIVLKNNSASPSESPALGPRAPAMRDAAAQRYRGPGIAAAESSKDSDKFFEIKGKVRLKIAVAIIMPIPRSRQQETSIKSEDDGSESSVALCLGLTEVSCGA